MKGKKEKGVTILLFKKKKHKETNFWELEDKENERDEEAREIRGLEHVFSILS